MSLTSLIGDMFVSYDQVTNALYPRSARQSFYGQIMQYIVTFATGVY
jgi:hypothetical protein